MRRRVGELVGAGAAVEQHAGDGGAFQRHRVVAGAEVGEDVAAERLAAEVDGDVVGGEIQADVVDACEWPITQSGTVVGDGEGAGGARVLGEGDGAVGCR